MSSEPQFRCPVCRASQTLSETCRRCQADLTLVVRARRRIVEVKRLRDEAIAGGDLQRERRLSVELTWLAPRD